jgi:HSP20 family protein
MATTNPLHPLSKDVAEQLREQMRRMLVRLDEIRALASSPSAWMPPVDVCEKDDSILVRAELPGVSRSNVRVVMLDNVLKVEGRKDRENPTGSLTSEEEHPIRFICLERSYGNFAFSISLKWPIDVADISARMANGVLHIRLPKAQTCGREITIQIEE